MNLLDYLDTHPEESDAIMGLPKNLLDGLMFARKDSGDGKTFVIDESTPKEYPNEAWIKAAVTRAKMNSQLSNIQDKNESKASEAIKQAVEENKKSTAALPVYSRSDTLENQLTDLLNKREVLGFKEDMENISDEDRAVADDLDNKIADLRARIDEQQKENTVKRNKELGIPERTETVVKKRDPELEAKIKAYDEYKAGEEKKRQHWDEVWEKEQADKKAAKEAADKAAAEEKESAKQDRMAAARKECEKAGIPMGVVVKTLEVLANQADSQGLDMRDRYAIIRSSLSKAFDMAGITRDNKSIKLSGKDGGKLYKNIIIASGLSPERVGISRSDELNSVEGIEAHEGLKKESKVKSAEKAADNSMKTLERQLEMLKDSKEDYGNAYSELLGNQVYGEGTPESPFSMYMVRYPGKTANNKNEGAPSYYIARQDTSSPNALFKLFSAMPRFTGSNRKSFKDSGMSAKDYFVEKENKPVGQFSGFYGFTDNKDPSKFDVAVPAEGYSEDWGKNVRDKYIKNILDVLSMSNPDSKTGLFAPWDISNSKDANAVSRKELLSKLNFDRTMGKYKTLTNFINSYRTNIDTHQSNGKTVMSKHKLDRDEALRELYRHGWGVFNDNSDMLVPLNAADPDDLMEVPGLDEEAAAKKEEGRQKSAAKFAEKHPEYAAENLVTTIESGSSSGKTPIKDSVKVYTKDKVIKPAEYDEWGRVSKPAEVEKGKLYKVNGSMSDEARADLGKKSKAEMAEATAERRDENKRADTIYKRLFPKAITEEQKGDTYENIKMLLNIAAQNPDFATESPELQEVLKKSQQGKAAVDLGERAIKNIIKSMSDEQVAEFENKYSKLSDKEKIDAFKNYMMSGGRAAELKKKKQESEKPVESKSDKKGFELHKKGEKSEEPDDTEKDTIGSMAKMTVKEPGKETKTVPVNKNVVEAIDRRL